MDDEDELLEAGRAPLPRPVRIAGTALIVALLVAVFAIRFWPDSHPAPHPAALGTPPPADTATSSSSPPADVGQTAWPTAPSACGGTTEVPIVTSRPPTENTGLKLLLGGSDLRVVDFDSGRVTPLPDAASGANAFVATLSRQLPFFATTMSCGGGGSRIYSVDANRKVVFLGKLRADQSLFADGSRAWLQTSPGSGTHSSVGPLAIGPQVRLPNNVYVVGIEDGTLIAVRSGPNSGTLLLLDPDTGRVQRRLSEIDSMVEAGAGRVAWTTGCDVTQDRPCRLNTLRLADGTRRQYLLPRPALGGTLSPDGSQIALLLEAEQNQRLDDSHPFPPSELAVLDLRSGQLRIVPHVLVPAKSFPGLAFNADGSWLAIALDAGRSTRLLAWHPGLGLAYEIGAVRGANYGSPPLATLPG